MVMQTWAEQYREILARSSLRTPLLAGYVDDGRQGSTVLPMGSRFSNDENKFVTNKEAEIEDKLAQNKGEINNQRMARVQGLDPLAIKKAGESYFFFSYDSWCMEKCLHKRNN